MVYHKVDDSATKLGDRMNKKKICLLIALMISMLIVIVPIQPANARLVLNNEFSPSAVTYTNLTFHFQDR